MNWRAAILREGDQYFCFCFGAEVNVLVVVACEQRLCLAAACMYGNGLFYRILTFPFTHNNSTVLERRNSLLS